MNAPTKEQLLAAVQAAHAVADAIKELGQVAEGQLYAVLVTKMDLDAFNKIVNILVDGNLIERGSNHMLLWKGDN